jgi:hypothetical protein
MWKFLTENCVELRPLGPWSDKAQFSFNNIPKLRQFIEMGLA